RRARRAPVRHAALRPGARARRPRPGLPAVRAPQRLRRGREFPADVARRRPGADDHGQRPAGGARRHPGDLVRIMNKSSLRTKLEEVRQAARIHGGFLRMCAAALGVKLARLPIPSRRLRSRLYRTVYGKKYAALNESELERPLADYPSFNALFTRGV